MSWLSVAVFSLPTIRNRLAFYFVLLMAVLCLQAGAYAHEMGMASLEINETSAGQGHLVFKRSRSADGRLAAIDFEMHPDCSVQQVATQSEHDREVIQTAKFNCAADMPLQSIQASGFVRLAPDLVVRVNRQGLSDSAILTPSQPVYQLDLPQSATGLMRHYFVLGFEHMAMGLDHLLFVTGLFLLWSARRQGVRVLVGLITGFTVGHSLTLALLSLGWLNLPVRAIEAWIALSVLYLAVKVMRAREHKRFTRSDYALIVAFGILHGAGFSAAMLDKGFPQEFLATTLIAFNLGIEAAQVATLAGLLLTQRLIDRFSGKAAVSARHQPSHQLSLILLGGMALFWTTERILAYV